MIEVEVKAKVENFQSIKENLKRRNATYKSNEVHRDYIYGFAEDFPPKDGGVIARIREKNGKFVLELKEVNRSTGGVELAFDIPELIAYQSFLTKLKFKYFFTIDKEREEYALDEYIICLDTVKDLGMFIEVEKMITSETLKAEARKECEMLLKMVAPDAIITHEKYGDKMAERLGIKK